MIVQVGPYPEPSGGVSVFVKRMKEYMDGLAIANEVWDLSGRGGEKKRAGVISARLALVPLKLLRRKDIDLLHYHICGVRSKLFIGLFNIILFRKRKKVLTIHGDARVLFGRHTAMLTRALNSFDAVICVRGGDLHYLRGRGVVTEIFEIPAFIFPHDQGGEAGLPDQIRDFIKDHGFVLCANASSLELYHGFDLYGIDMCIRLTAKLKETTPEIRPGFIFCLTAMNDAARFREFQRMIEAVNIRNDFLFVTTQVDLCQVIRNCQLFIRPTGTDGYSLSLAEALYLGIPSIASDAVPRPEGTVLFKTRDDQDLFRQTVAISKNYERYQNRVRSLKFEDNARQLLNVYQKLSGKTLLLPGPVGRGKITEGT